MKSHPARSYFIYPILEGVKKHIQIFSVYGRNLRRDFFFGLWSFRISLVGIFFLLFFFQCIPVFSQEMLIPEKMVFKGLHKTKETIVRREMAFSARQPLAVKDTAVIFRKCLNNLFNTRLFNTCRYYLDSLKTNDSGMVSANVVFVLQERWYTIPIPLLELADRNFNEWWYDRNRDFRRINAGLTIMQKNVRGRNEDLMLGIQTGFTKKLYFSYFIPYLDKKQIFGVKLQTILLSNKEVAVRSSNNILQYQKDENSFGRERVLSGIQITARKSIYQYHSLDVNYYYSRVSPFVLNLNPDYFLGESFQRYSEIRYSYTLDHRNYRIYATKGWYMQARVSKLGILPTDNFRLWTGQASFSAYLPMGNGFFYASRFDGEIGQSRRLPYLGSRTLGYENRFVRGYERNVMEGNSSFHFRNSLRKKILGKVWEADQITLSQFRRIPLDIYLCPFLDFGGIRNPWVLPENKPLVNTFLLGYGVGLHMVTFYDLVFRTEFTFNRQGGRGLYFSLISDI